MQSILNYLRRPLVAGLVGGLVGIILGLVWAWGIQPVEWTDVPPSDLGTTFQVDYMRMLVDSYSQNGDVNLALQRWQALGSSAPSLLSTVEGDGSLSVESVTGFRDALDIFMDPSASDNLINDTSGQDQQLMNYAIIIGALIVVGGVSYMLFRTMRLSAKRRSSEAGSSQHEHEPHPRAEVTDYAAMGEDPPILQFVTSYTLGTDLFDDSFSIDSPSGDVLGECGFAIAKPIGVSESPKRVTAFEIWLFDKHDIETVTKVLMSRHAYEDENIYRELQAKGELMQVDYNSQVVLETKTLLMVATVTNFAYGDGSMPPESYFDHLTLEIAIWQTGVS